MPREGIDLILQSREQDVKRTQDIPEMIIYTKKGRAISVILTRSGPMMFISIPAGR